MPNPNPLSTHIAFEQNYFGNKMLEFNSLKEAENHLLALKLWNESLRQIFFHKNMIVLQTHEDVKLDMSLIESILIENIALFETNENDNTYINDVEQKIENCLEDYIRPYLATHGGTVKLRKFENGCAYLSLHGSCDGCPSAEETLYYHVEMLLKLKIDELERVELIK